MSKRRYAVVAGAIVAFVALGFIQERAKVSLNYYLDVTASSQTFFDLPPERRDEWLNARSINAPYDYYYNHKPVAFYHQLSREQLQQLKWAYALTFIVAHLIIGVLTIRLFQAERTDEYTLYIYVTIAIVLSLGFFALSRFISNPQPAYAVARKLLGFGQSPLPLIIVFFSRNLKSRIH